MFSDSMDIDAGPDPTFAYRYLRQFKQIDARTLQALAGEGYDTKEKLLALDLELDLPLLQLTNMAQRSLLRQALRQLHDSVEEEEQRQMDEPMVKRARNVETTPELEPRRRKMPKTGDRREDQSSGSDSNPSLLQSPPPLLVVADDRKNRRSSGGRQLTGANSTPTPQMIELAKKLEMKKTAPKK